MATVATSAAKRRDWRVIVFRVVAGLLILFYTGVGMAALVSPWVRWSFGDPNSPLGDAGFGAAFVILNAGTLLALWWRPREQPLLMQFYILNQILFAVGSAFIDGFQLVPLLLFLVLPLIAYPAPRALLQVSRAEPFSVPLLVLGLAAAALLALDASAAFQSYRAGGGSENFRAHWPLPMIDAIGLMLTALLPATKRPGWRALAIIVGLFFIYRGAASLTWPNDLENGWGMLGGSVALLGGLAYLAVTWWETRKAQRITAVKG